jgi:hypothetical protein
MGELWGHTFATERDRQADQIPNAKAQHRGQISRELQAQLEAELQKAL